MHRLTRLFVAALFCSGWLSADIIDFEAAGPSGTNISSIVTATNTVGFDVAPNGGTTFGAGGGAFVADVGGVTTAFLNNDEVIDDAPLGNAGQLGNFFLTNEDNGPTVALDYLFTFMFPIMNLSLDLADFNGDGGAGIGAQAVLEVFSDGAFTTLASSDSYTTQAGDPDGLVVNLSTSAASISSARLTFVNGLDVGTGIDNINFDNVTAIPEPGTITLFGAGLLAVAAIARRKGFLGSR